MEGDALTALQTFTEQFPGIQQLILMVGYLAGLVMSITGLHMWATNGHRGHNGHGTLFLFGLILGGALLMSLITTVTYTGNSLMASSTDPRIVLGAVAVDRENPGMMILRAATNLAALLGWVAAIRGIYYIAMAGSRKQTSFSVGFWLLVSAGALTNLGLFMTLSARSLGADGLLPYFRDL